VGAIAPTGYRAKFLDFTQPFMELPSSYIIPAPKTAFNPASLLNPFQLSVPRVFFFFLK
jgi:hypothetical protein